jgi:hypothetical protein
LFLNGFRGEEILKSANQKQESPVAAMFVNGSGQNELSLQRITHRYFLQSFSNLNIEICIQNAVTTNVSLYKYEN